ncbi:unnamed protein product [Durusdinium trenchii]|uniref:Guanosine-3',5'-bis(diphosphate) 3'-pyrophosphohydrolase MESH1 n=1 Tax=Durusdinium trenchii TaxID=1381693 RepID=A0ABP0PPQ1_9DINO
MSSLIDRAAMAAPTLALPHAHVPLTGVAAASAVRPRTEMRYCCRAAGPPAVAASLPGCLVLRRGLKRTTRAFSAAGHVAPVAPVAEAEVSQAAFPVAGYNWEICTQQNYAQKDSQVAEGPLAAARRLVDASYHGHYTLERQRFQDTLVRRLVELNGHGAPLREPRLVFTAGAMGVGKSHVIRWLAEKGILPMPLGRVESTRKDFVHINPDHLAAQLPEYMGYMEHNRACAAVMTRLEAGLLTELSLMYALQQKRNILVDSSLRHGSWYSRVLQKIRQKLPEVRVVLMYVHAHEETIYERANQRGLEGRMVSHVEVADSLEKIPLAIQKLLPYMDTFIQVDNDGHEPELTSVCQQPREDLDAYCEVDPDPSSMGFGWKSVKDILHTDLEPGEALLEPPEILPSAATEPQPLAALFRTIHFAATKHQNQTRKNPQRTPYINHPLAVARILAEVGIRDLKTLQAALLHDTLEDTEATRAELEAAFGAEVANLVHALTDEEGLRPLHQKFRQLRRVKSLPLKAKLVRIADKLHNVWDIMHHGIPGWSKGKTERYVAWACEMVDALRGTHTALEQRFHSEVSLPKGYQLGDWQEFAVQEMGWALLEDLEHDGGSAAVPPPELAEHRAVLSLLRAAEVVAAKSDEELLESVKFALFLSGFGIKDPETLKAAVLLGSVDEHSITASQFGGEVASILAELNAHWPRIVKNHKAKRIYLGKHLYELRKLQIGTMSSQEDLDHFQQLLERTISLREQLRGAHPRLEEGIDAMVGNGQVRLASGELTPVDMLGDEYGIYGDGFL